MTYYYWKAEILKEECEKIISEFDTSLSGKLASVGNLHGTEGLYPEEIEAMKKEGRWDYLHNKSKNEDVPDTSIRKTKLNWLPANHIYNKILCEFVTTTNEKHYHYNLTKFTPCQFARYDVGDFYDYHQDSGQSKEDYENETRKLSMTVQLSDPDSYEGGKFLFYNGHKKETEPPIQEQGSIIIFDSKMWHRVTPVTKGVRYSLVSWSLGPSFQ